MKYKGFTITTTEQLGGYGWEAYGSDGEAMAYPQRQGDRPYKTKVDAMRAAKSKINQLKRRGF